MKLKTLLTAAALLVFGQIFAQNQEGIIEFESKMNLHRGISSENSQMKAMIPEFRTSKNRLFFNANTSFFTNVEDEEEPEEMKMNQGGNQIQMRFQRPQNDTYRNFEAQTFVTLTELGGKKFRIEDSLKAQGWKFGEETKEVAGYKCMKATFRDEAKKQDVVAWFTDAIVCPSGPLNFWGLPGMILEIDINEAQTVISAKKVEFKALKSEMKIPTAGKKVTAKEFKKTQDEYFKEMGMQPGGGPKIMIRNG